MDGYIKLHRKIFNNKDYFKESFDKFHAWVDLLLLASEKDSYITKRGIRIMVKRGQIAEGIDVLSKRWKWTRGKVRTYLNGLQNDQKIVQKNIGVTTLISVVNYNKYQSDHTLNHTSDHTLERTQEIKKKKIKPSAYHLATELNLPGIEHEELIDVWPSFEDFWDEYDKKVGPQKILRAQWNNFPQLTKEKIMRYIPRYKQAQPNKQYRKNPTTFFNQESWNDELIFRDNGTTENGNNPNELSPLYQAANKVLEEYARKNGEGHSE